MEKTNCFFCGSECVGLPTRGDAEGYDCEYCGMYEISGTALSDREFRSKLDENKHIFAGYLQETKDNREDVLTILSDKIDMILNDRRVPKSAMHKIEKLLLYCYERNEYIGQEFTSDGIFIRRTFNKDRYYLNGNTRRIGIAYSRDTEELNGIIQGTEELNWMRVSYNDAGDIVCFSITATGLQYAEQLMTSNINSNKVFVAIEYHKAYKTRLSEAIYPACSDCGFDAFIIDDVEHNNGIMDEMIVAIKQSKFIIADLTNNNSGVYYEAGYAKGMERDVIKCCSKQWLDEDKKNKIHFDLSGEKIILYNDLEDLKKKLKSRIRATIEGANLEDQH